MQLLTFTVQFYNSPNEPLFWLHHGNVDRMWWIWQNQKPTERAFQIAGTRTMLNIPPSDNATIDDNINLGILGADSPIRNHVSSVGGQYCYIYV